MSMLNTINTGNTSQYQIDGDTSNSSNLLNRLEQRVNQALKLDKPNSKDVVAVAKTLSTEDVRGAVADLAKNVNQPMPGMNLSTVV